MSTFTIPSLYIGQPDATLTVEPDTYGDSYAMTLTVGGRIVAEGDGFRPGASSDFGDGEHAAHTAYTFGSFLAHALESSEEGAQDGWTILADDADDWTDALALYEGDVSGACEEAHALGVEAAQATATWATTDATEAKHILAMLGDDDPAAWDALPAMPTLSGEWSGESPADLVRDLLGTSDVSGETLDALCEAWETGVSEAFETACERELRKVTS